MKKNQSDDNNVPIKQSWFMEQWGSFFRSRFSTLRVYFFSGCAAFFFTWGAFYYNNRHVPPWLSTAVFSMGGLFAAFSGRQIAINYKHTDKTANRWCLAVIITSTILASINLYFEYRHAEKRLMLRIVPIEGLQFRQTHESITIKLGGGVHRFLDIPYVPPGQRAEAYLFSPYIFNNELKVIIENDHIFCDFEWAQRFGIPPLKLKHNAISGVPFDWDCNFNGKALEIVNDKTNPIFQIYYKDDTHIVLEGVFITTNRAIFASEKDGINSNFGRKDITNAINQQYFDEHFQALNLKRIFKYPAWKHPGQFADE